MINTKVNPANDNHLLSGNNISTGEGMIAVILEDGTSKNLYRNSALDTAALAAWCTKVDDIYTLVATSPIDGVLEIGDVVKNADGSADYATIYNIFAANTNWIELISQNIPEHVFVSSSSLSAAQLDELEKLTDMQAHKLLESLYEKECEQYCTLSLASGATRLDLTEPNPLVVTWRDENMRRVVTTFSYTVTMYNADGTESSLPRVTTGSWTKDGCIATVPSTFVDGFAKVKFTFLWNTSDGQYRVGCIVNLTSWNDPVICVDTLEMYDMANAMGMIISPAKVDPTNFVNANDLTDEQMSNPAAIEIMVQKNWIKATTAKISYIMNFGYSEADATVLAKRIMVLSEAKAITAPGNAAFKETVGTDINGNTISYNASVSIIANPVAIDYTTDHVVQLTHFESFGYFINVTTIPQQCFQQCKHLVTIFLPVNVVTLGNNVFDITSSLKNVGTLED